MAAAALIALLAAAEAAAPAQSADRPAAAAERPLVEIALASGAPAAAAAVSEDLQELLARIELQARYRRVDAVDRDEVLRPPGQSPCALACIWIDLGVASPGRALVYISATASEQVAIRSLPLPNGVDEVAREEVSHIVASSIEALRAGRPLPTSPERDAIAAAKVEPAPAPPPAGVWASMGLGAGVARESSDLLALPTVALSLLVGPEGRRLAPAVWLQGAGFASDVGSAPVALSFRGGELAALGALATSPHGRAVARLGLGAGAELRSATPAFAGPSSAGVALAGQQLDPTVFVRAAARFEYRLWGRVGLFAAAALDGRVMSHRYTISTDGVTQGVFQPDRVRPSIVVGLDALLAAPEGP